MSGAASEPRLSSLPILERQFSCHLHFRLDSFATYAYSCCIFSLEFLFFKPKVNLFQHLARSESDLTSIFRGTLNRLCDFKHF